MKFCIILCLVLFVVQAWGGKGKFKKMPENLDDCLKEMESKMEMKIKKKMAKGKAFVSCAGDCMSDAAKKCIGFDDFVSKKMELKEALKTQLMKAKKDAHTCLKKKCSKTPINFAPCAKDMLMTFASKDKKGMKSCMMPCMMKQMKALKEDMSSSSEGGKGGKGGKGKRRRHGKGKRRMKGGCLPIFCTIDQMMSCADSAGLKDMWEKKERMMFEIDGMVESKFKDTCECLKKNADELKILPSFLTDKACDATLTVETCNAMIDFKKSKFMKKMKEMFGDDDDEDDAASPDDDE